MNILVIDDVAAVQVTITAALKAAGHTVTLAGSGSEALKCLQVERFDVVVTDLWMPDGDGLRLIKELRSREAPPRIIAITGGGPKLSIELASSLAEVWGAEHVLVKPFDDRKLLSLVEAAKG